jgi:chromosome segregation ATPase
LDKLENDKICIAAELSSKVCEASDLKTELAEMKAKFQKDISDFKSIEMDNRNQIEMEHSSELSKLRGKLNELNSLLITQKKDSMEADNVHEMTIKSIKEEYDHKIQLLDDKYMSLVSEAESLRAQNESLVASLSLKDGDNAGLVDKLNKDLDVLRKQLEQEKVAALDLQSELEVMHTAEITKLRARISESISNHESAQKELAEAVESHESKVQSLKKDHDRRVERLKQEYTEQIDEKEALLQRISSEVVDLKSQLKLMSSGQSDVATELNRIKAESQAEVKALKERIDNAESVLQSKSYEVDELTSALSKEKESSRRQAESIKATEADLRSEMEVAHTAEVTKLRARISESISNYESAQKELAEAVESHEKKVQSLKKDHDRRIDRLKQEYMEQLNEMEQMSESLEKSTVELSELKSQVKLASLSNLGREAEIQKTQSELFDENERLKSEMENVRRSAQEEAAMLNNCIELLQEQLRVKGTEFAEMVKKYNGELVSCRNELETHSSETTTKILENKDKEYEENLAKKIANVEASWKLKSERMVQSAVENIEMKTVEKLRMDFEAEKQNLYAERYYIIYIP